jgi:hypothetical protein
MFKQLALSSAIVVALAAPAFAQTSTTTAPRTTTSTTLPSSQIDGHKLIGQSIQSEADNKTVGKIDSVILDRSGKVDKVVVGVGGFLGMGKKDVALDWSRLHVADNGRKVTMNADKDQLKAMPEYTWPKEHGRGSVWSAADTNATTSSGSAGTSSTMPSPGTSGTTTTPRTAPSTK